MSVYCGKFNVLELNLLRLGKQFKLNGVLCITELINILENWLMLAYIRFLFRPFPLNFQVFVASKQTDC